MKLRTSHTVRASSAVLAALAGVLVLALPAGATNRTMHRTLDTWSVAIGTDARAISRAARLRHPRHMTATALHFRADALKARAALRSAHPSNAAGRKAQRLALAAFADYASAGSRWAASGRARVQKHTALARTRARAAAVSARSGNSLLRRVALLLR